MNITPYKLSDKWTRDPILWSATDEVTPHGGHGDSHASTTDLIGGSASGKW